MVADWDKINGHMTIYMTSQAPHAHRTVFSLVSGLPEQQIRIISPDIGGGFGGKVPVYPGYVLCAVASLVTGKPVKWIEDRSENRRAKTPLSTLWREVGGIDQIQQAVRDSSR
jgi:carbon-monoxide dehydrogenase large subunit